MARPKTFIRPTSIAVLLSVLVVLTALRSPVSIGSGDNIPTWISAANAFVTSSNARSRPSTPDGSSRPLPPTYTYTSTPSVALNSMGDDWFESFKKFFGGMGGDESPKSSSSSKNDKINSDDEDDDLPAGTTVLLSIPAKQLKPGGLRLFLMFYLLGMQNTPHANAWKANQPVASGGDEHVLEMYFHDATGMIQIELLNHEDPDGSEVRVLRCGSLPSTAYLMQESVIVDGILDELQQCAFDDSIALSDRLLIPEPPTAIEDAREALAFG